MSGGVANVPPGTSPAAPLTRGEKLTRFVEDAYPEMLRELQSTFDLSLQAAGVEPALAVEIAASATDDVAKHFGGCVIYIPRAARYFQRRRWLAICAEFDGKNHNQLAAKYAMSVQNIYKILSASQDRQRQEAARNAAATPAANPERGIDASK